MDKLPTKEEMKEAQMLFDALLIFTKRHSKGHAMALLACAADAIHNAEIDRVHPAVARMQSLTREALKGGSK